MSSHNRRDPNLPDLKSVADLRDVSVSEIMERARKRIMARQKTKWEKYGKNAISAAEQAEPEEKEP